MNIMIILAGVAVLVAVAAAFAGAYLYRIWREQRVRRALMSVIRRDEAIKAAVNTLNRLLERLASASDEELLRFASDPEDEDRVAFGEVANSMRIVVDELERTEAPKSVESIVLEMEGVAGRIAAAAGSADGVGDDRDVLAAAGSIDLVALGDLVRQMDVGVHELASQHGISDSSVYGGGLYI